MITTELILAAVKATRDAYLANARTLYAAQQNTDAASQYRRAGILNLLASDERLCEVLAERIRILGGTNGSPIT